MKKCKTTYGCAHAHIAIREVDGILDITIVQVIHQLFDCHHGTIILGFFCGCARCGVAMTFSICITFAFGKSVDIAFYTTGSQRLCHIVVIYQKVTRKV